MDMSFDEMFDAGLVSWDDNDMIVPSVPVKLRKSKSVHLGKVKVNGSSNSMLVNKA